MEGNERFRTGNSTPRRYTQEDFERIDREQKPKAVVVACSDSRVAPTPIFDQGLGDLFTARVPGNVASETTRWVVELAIREFNVPLAIVMAHTNCLAVSSVFNNDTATTGGLLRSLIKPAAIQAKRENIADPITHCSRLNAKNTISDLCRDSVIARRAFESGEVAFVPLLYVMRTGTVEPIGER
jgi:carbonic anhydrase